jgi:hypothetical protein
MSYFDKQGWFFVSGQLLNLWFLERKKVRKTHLRKGCEVTMNLMAQPQFRYKMSIME